MAWTSKPLYIGAHVWFAPLDAAFTSPSAGTVSQSGTWPDANEANWANWALGVVESFEIDPKPGTQEDILAPSPGAVQRIDVAVPYALPTIKIVTLYTDVLAPQLALNAQQLWATATTQYNPNGAGSPGMRGILKMQTYDQSNNLINNFESWVYLKLSTPYKGAPKTMTKPEYEADLIYSANNTGSI